MAQCSGYGGYPWLLLGWVTAERSCPCKQPVCPAVGGDSEVTIKPLVPRLKYCEFPDSQFADTLLAQLFKVLIYLRVYDESASYRLNTFVPKMRVSRSAADTDKMNKPDKESAGQQQKMNKPDKESAGVSRSAAEDEQTRQGVSRSAADTDKMNKPDKESAGVSRSAADTDKMNKPDKESAGVSRSAADTDKMNKPDKESAGQQQTQIRCRFCKNISSRRVTALIQLSRCHGDAADIIFLSSVNLSGSISTVNLATVN
ncbi:hypothetical protein J6590_079548 [Homalodisca vitripennis]|nr:hypothetical protein J6590_079548 [Homalodisca vitripennis]